ncbi:hypothetical protein PPL_12135 [Heterostelium album PN500]|uniref:Uncharacterized protein n=1 Tax=Heterostelium pallidum (strain ATCC 26659 / Pp 5 / PN500) TaxID=670386 RepID=D3BLT1_HETP5|nr:hypothetical protein PPL_12135 [Heterostelium album PN500]EFA77532.1 hypothetical protein PPL_12135 [Heterostelium album PN500]|eukprot:XP_020429660.1 hypothetical protein PPL_12135 [Heterostelium album PN500]
MICSTVRELDAPLPTDCVETLRDFRLTVFHDASIQHEMKFLSACKNLTKVAFTLSSAANLETIISYLSETSTLQSVALSLDICDAILSWILSNPSIKKLTVGAINNYHQLPIGIVAQKEELVNTTLEKLKFLCIFDNHHICNSTDRYDIFLHPNKYVTSLKQIRYDTLISDNLAWIEDIGVPYSSLVRMSLDTQCYQSNLDIGRFEKLMTINQTLQYLTLGISICEQIKDVNLFVKLLDASVSLQTIELILRAGKSNLKNRLLKSNNYYQSHVIGNFDNHHFFVRKNQDNNTQQGGFIKKSISYLKSFRK